MAGYSKFNTFLLNVKDFSGPAAANHVVEMDGNCVWE